MDRTVIRLQGGENSVLRCSSSAADGEVAMSKPARSLGSGIFFMTRCGETAMTLEERD